MLMLSQTGWPPLQTVACVELVLSRFTISCNQPVLARPQLVLFIKIDADFLSGRLTGPLKLIPIWQPFKSKSCHQTPSERFRGQKQCPRVRGAGSIAQSAVDLLYSIVNHRPGGLRSPVHRTGWLGGAGLGLQSPVCIVPEDSVPFGRGPAGCGAAAKKRACLTKKT